MIAPTWEQLRDAGRVVIDQPDRGLAIFPTTHGVIVVGVKSQDGTVQLASIQLCEMDAVANALAECEARAAAALEMMQEQQSEIAAYHLIQRAMGAA
jgi:hypothetical protein